jgi:DNA segregation ATPase FtsK/SpoIIIE-like protein
VTIAEKLGGIILGILTFASNRTRRDDTWVDEEEYEEEEYDDEPAAPRESRRARILRGALARRKRVAEKFANPLGRKTDAALFSGKRMDDDEEEIAYSARGVAADADDVLFSGHRATQPDIDAYDPLLSGQRATEPVSAAAAAMTAAQAYAAPASPVVQPRWKRRRGSQLLATMRRNMSQSQSRFRFRITPRLHRIMSGSRKRRLLHHSRKHIRRGKSLNTKSPRQRRRLSRKR